jgi:hypothetical protein
MRRKLAHCAFSFRIVTFTRVLYLCLAVILAGCRDETHPAVAHHAAEANPREANIVVGIEDMGGEVILDETNPEKSVIEVRLTCCNLADAWLERLSGLTRLKSLSLNATNVTDAGLKRIEGLKCLQELSLYRTLVTDAGLEHLKALTKLQRLNLTSVNPVIKRAGSTGRIPRAYSSSGLPAPNPLGLPGPHVTDVGLEHLKALTNLQSLSLKATDVTDAGMKHLGDLVNLGTLDLNDTGVGDAGLEHLKRLTKLQDLSLFNTNVTDSGLEHLKGMTSLQWLDLGGSSGPIGNVAVTDAGLEHLKGLTNLLHLGLWGTKVSAESANRLRQALPKCRIDSPYGDFKPRMPGYRELIPGTHYWRQIPDEAMPGTARL